MIQACTSDLFHTFYKIFLTFQDKSAQGHAHLKRVKMHLKGPLKGQKTKNYKCSPQTYSNPLLMQSLLHF